MKKYDFNFCENSSSSQSIIANEVAIQSSVLEFGIANGVLTEYLKNIKNCIVDGVEFNKEDASIALSHARDICVCDIENYEWVDYFKEEKYDYIIFGDVLEHLYSPSDVLKKSVEFLKPDGKLIISVPNVAHNSIIMQLLNDDFDYQETGLLDNTHIRFFTKNTLDDLVDSSGLKILKRMGVYKTPEETEFPYRYTNFNHFVSDHLSRRVFGEVYQFVLVLQRNECLTSDLLKKINKAKLYVNTGDGYSEQQVLEYTYNIENSFDFDLSSFSNVHSLRFDPSDRPVKFSVRKIEVDGDEVTEINHNAIEFNNVLYYTHDDPFIEFYLPNGGVNNLSISLSEIDFDLSSCFRPQIIEDEVVIEDDLPLPDENLPDSFVETAKLYIDLGNGYSESNVISETSSSDRREYSFNTSNYSKVDALRFDLCSRPVICSIQSIIIDGIEHKNFKCNAIVKGNILYFMNDDPMIIISDIDEPVSQVSIIFNDIRMLDYMPASLTNSELTDFEI